MITNEEYLKIKDKEVRRAKEIVAKITSSTNAAVKYKDSRPITDIREMLRTSVEKYAGNVAFHQKEEKGKEYRQITYKEAGIAVDRLGTALVNLGLKDKKISMIGDNCYNWAISYLASVCGTGITVPLDKELNTKELEKLVDRAQISCVIFTNKYKETFKEMKAKEGSPLEVLINMEAKEDEGEVRSLSKLLEAGEKLLQEGNRDFIDAQILNDQMSVILFTSGTTGTSKGVMLSHSNIAADLMVAPTILKVNTWDIFFSVLPLHHTYECTCGFLMPLYKGASIAYCEGIKYITKNLEEVKPTMFLGVPVLFETLHKKIWQNVRKKGKEKLLRKVIKANKITKKVGLDLGNIFFKEIRGVFGGNMRMMICGGAAINPEVLQGIRDFGIVALQGYGLTECAPMGALNPDTAPKNGSIGTALPGFHMEIRGKGEDGIGEICLQGENIMLGYYGMPEETAEVLKDDWFYTGDLGYIDEDGYAYITGRAKNVIITKNGKNVFPEELEYYINIIPFVQESMVYGQETGDGHDTTIVAAIKLDKEELEEQFGEKTNEEIQLLVWAEIDKINEEQPFFKKIKKVVIREEEFEKSTTKKIKRFIESNKN